jgi:uncharacterized protein YbaR (Trm112 family)
MVLRDDILACLRCPVTGSKLELAEGALLARVNQLIAQHQVQTRISDPVTVPLTAGLVNVSRTLLYRIDAGIVSLLASEAIEIAEADESA